MAIRNKGNKYQVDVTVKGVRAPRVSCDTLHEAQAVEAQFKAHLLAGGDPADLVQDSGKAKASKGPTLGDLLDVTIRDEWKGTKAETSSIRNGSVWPDELGYDFLLSDLKPDNVTEVCDRLAVKGNSGGTINRKLAALGKMLTIGQRRGWVQKFKLPKKKEYTGRLRYFTDDEMESLIDFAKGDIDMLNLIILGVETGMRQGELLALTPRDIDLKRGLIIVNETKSDENRSVPITEEAKVVCARLIKGLKAHQRVFDTRLTSENISRFMRRWKHHRDLPDEDEAVFHTLRHTTCSRLVQEGVPLVIVQNWMGHKVIETTMKYAHLAPNSLDIALKALNDRKGT
ncbi:tyrosine-type recombinase/integrase [Shimia sp.]|uniref:tyrosine-type recombinase/integrase n=1 Tax=Shimia sp. TaxID=1954381 RepID=UPI003BAA6E5B